MFTMAAQSMGYRVAVLEPSCESPAGGIAEHHVCTEYLDPAGLKQLARICAAATTEFENVPADSLRFLAGHCVVSPSADSVAVAQDRVHEKQFLAASGLGVVPFAVVRAEGELLGAPEGLFPGILKVSRFGYDGKGQYRVSDAGAAVAAFAAMGGEPCVLERQVALTCEISVVVARGDDGAVATYPVAENQHHHGILDVSIVPARVSPALADRAGATAVHVAEALDYRGVLCVELFVLEDGQMLVNEIAPRPHNSGHYTLDACVTSQFEQQVRVLCGLPLGDTALHSPAVMVNLLGDLWRVGEPDWRVVFGRGRAKLHLYGKRAARPGRKMGHVTVLGATVEQALEDALAIRQEMHEGAGLDPQSWREKGVELNFALRK
jgi:5-(carboxyamino)imidazole ribonucleotide synthase